MGARYPYYLLANSPESRYMEGGKESGKEKRAAIFIGPEFGTVSRPDLVQVAREAGAGVFDVLITCAFNYDAHSSEFSKLGRIQVLKARMNADLHMADDLKNTGKGNLFVIFGEPDIEIHYCAEGYIRMQVHGVDVFHPSTGEVRSDGPEGIACWFIDTDYNEESFFVRHAYFLGANDPYKALKTTLKAQINEEAWKTLHSAISRPFKPSLSGRIAVKVINHLGDEVMKVRPFFPFHIIPERKNTPPFRTFPVPGGILYFKKTIPTEFYTFPTNIFGLPTEIFNVPTEFIDLPTDIFSVPTKI
ncbi:MAG: adenine-specific DNA-methyltransferase [Acidobacteriota bacterium]|nr:adenine-specific DNA-methyltransferase [Acidobacteriota bacterium]